MATVDSHPPGSFCWIELGTTDQSGAVQFYKQLFDWTSAKVPSGPSGVYMLFSLEGRDAAGCYTLTPEMKAAGVPAHWMLYIAVDNADEAAAKVTSAGGKVMRPPFDVMDLGRMAVLQDPTGGMFSVWQPKKHSGIGIEGLPGTLCWADLMTFDQQQAVKFYQEVFGWQFEEGKDGSGYLHIKNAGKHIGGMPDPKYLKPKSPPHWELYFQVLNCDESTAKAKEAGAKVYIEPTTMEGVGRWSVVGDPQGATFALFQPGR